MICARTMNIVLLAILIFFETEVRAYGLRLPFFSRRPIPRNPVTNLALQHHIAALQLQCYDKEAMNECPVYPTESQKTKNILSNFDSNLQSISGDLDIADKYERIYMGPIDQPFRRMFDQTVTSNVIPSPLRGVLHGYKSQSGSITNGKLNLKLNISPSEKNTAVKATEEIETVFEPTSKEYIENGEVTTALVDVESPTNTNSSSASISEKFAKSRDSFERKFYATTFSKLSSMSPASRRENGMSYVQSGLFLHLALMALSTEVDPETKQEIDNCLELDLSDEEKLELINSTMSSLPVASDDLKFRWSSRLVLRSQTVSQKFRDTVAPALRLQIDSFNGTETTQQMTDALNHMVEVDSGGAIHNTFEEDELSAEVRGVLVTTLYLRARWRSAPTLLNGSHVFRDAAAPPRTARMIRINDVMRYADLPQWDAEALEISYSTPGLSLLLLVPREPSLRSLAAAASSTSLDDIAARMQTARVAATLPLYTLRMTLLLPNKLQAMNISRLVGTDNAPERGFRLSLAVQRIMFWAEAGRNAFKDDGIEWDEAPERELVVDRPYIFYVRWKNNTIMNGNFVL